MATPSNPIEDIATGLGKAALEWTAERISLLTQRFANREVGFIQDLQTIELGFFTDFDGDQLTH
jgi:hypothetical protein